MNRIEPARDSRDDRKIARRKLSDQVYERLREMIEAGEIEQGELMPSERELMEQFGVGRPAVREAMQMMHGMGLITISHGGRARVNELSTGTVIRNMEEIGRLLLSTAPENLEHLKEARRMFELGMVRVAAERATQSDCAELQELLDRQRRQISEATEFIRADMDFHIRIAKISANPIFAGLSEAILSWLFMYHTDLLHWNGKEKTTLKEHEEILSAIVDRNADLAVAAMRGHLDRSSELYQHGH